MSKLASNGGTPVHDSRTRPWPTWPEVSEEKWSRQEHSFREVYLSAVEGIPRPRCERFAKAFCEYLGTAHGLMTTSGTSALKLALGAVTDTDGAFHLENCPRRHALLAHNIC